MKDYCANCDIENCELRDQVCFCEDCKYYWGCDIKYELCDGLHQIECNNGFEPESIWDDYEEEK